MKRLHSLALWIPQAAGIRSAALFRSAAVFRSAVVLVLLSTGVACDEGATDYQDPDTESDSTGDGDSGGSVTCDEWKADYCDWMQACGSVSTFDACLLQIETVECASKAPLERCQEELRKTDDCTSIPEDCDAKDVADTEKAEAQCDAFLAAYCQNYLACQPTAYETEASCRNAVELTLPCDTAYAVSETYEQCISELSAGSCGEYLPPSCQEVVFLQ